MIMMRRGGGRPIMAAAATASMVSTARTNRAVRKNIEGQNEAQAAANQQTASVAQDDPAAQLAQFKSLLDQGLISQDDYDAKKKELLGL